MNYRITQEFKPPFRINALIEEAGLLKVGYIFKWLEGSVDFGFLLATFSVEMLLC